METHAKTKISAGLWVALLYGLAAIIPAGCNTTKNTVETTRSVIGRSNFIFSGTVLKANGSNIEVKVAGPAAIVRIDDVLDAVSPYEQYKGKEVTVLLTTARDMKDGDKQVFYTMGWYYGKNLGLKEISNDLWREKSDTLKQQIAHERVNIVNDSLRAELNRAEVVVEGIVMENNIEVKIDPSIESEHSPEYKRAIIEVKQVLKGNVNGKTVEVYYSPSEDVAWYSAPKLTKGEQGIFLLQRRQGPERFKIEGYSVLDKRDVQPESNLPLVQSLLKK